MLLEWKQSQRKIWPIAFRQVSKMTQTIGDVLLAALRAIAQAERLDPNCLRTAEEWTALAQVRNAIAIADEAISQGSKLFSTPQTRRVE
jgi:hypothetical protein